MSKCCYFQKRLQCASFHLCTSLPLVYVNLQPFCLPSAPTTVEKVATGAMILLGPSLLSLPLTPSIRNFTLNGLCWQFSLPTRNFADVPLVQTLCALKAMSSMHCTAGVLLCCVAQHWVYHVTLDGLDDCRRPWLIILQSNVLQAVKSTGRPAAMNVVRCAGLQSRSRTTHQINIYTGFKILNPNCHHGNVLRHTAAAFTSQMPYRRLDNLTS